MKMGQWAVPVLIVALTATGTLYLARQDRAVKVTDQGVPVQPPAPKWEMPGYRQPVLAQPVPGQEQAAPGRNNPTAVPVPGGVIRSLDKINAAAARVGCPVLVPNDPAGKLLDVAECLGEKAVQTAPGQK